MNCGVAKGWAGACVAGRGNDGGDDGWHAGEGKEAARVQDGGVPDAGSCHGEGAGGAPAKGRHQLPCQGRPWPSVPAAACLLFWLGSSVLRG